MPQPLSSHRPGLAIVLKISAIGFFSVMAAMICDGEPGVIKTSMPEKKSLRPCHAHGEREWQWAYGKGL